MLATGDWSLPRVPGGAYGRKPPPLPLADRAHRAPGAGGARHRLLPMDAAVARRLRDARALLAGRAAAGDRVPRVGSRRARGVPGRPLPADRVLLAGVPGARVARGVGLADRGRPPAAVAS